MRPPKEIPKKDAEQPIEFDILLNCVNRKMNLEAEAHLHEFQAAVLETAI